MPRHATLHLALCTDRHHFVGVAPAIRSILANTQHPPEGFSFHFVVGLGESDELLATVRGAFPAPRFRYQVAEFRASPFLDDYIRAGRDSTYAEHASSVMNFSRFYLGDIYPEIGKFVYLDADVIVQGDIAELFRVATLKHHDLAAVPFATFGTWEDGFRPDWDLLRTFDPLAPVFNCGVYVTDLAKWRRAVPELERWMRIHRQSMESCVFGTQSIMNLAFYRNVEVLSPEWNVGPLGYDENLPEQALKGANILHWAGQRKPWKADGLYREYWKPYAASPRDGGPAARPRATPTPARDRL